MLLIGFYFTPSVVGRTIIAILIAVKYWFFSFGLKQKTLKMDNSFFTWLKSAVILGVVLD